MTKPSSAHCALRRYLGLAAAACLFGGCATEVGTYTSLGPHHAPNLANHPVEVFAEGLPKRPFERVAILDAHCESQWFATPNLKDDGLPELTRQASAAGCDAIIEIQEKKLSAGDRFETRVKHYTAVGVTYK